MGCVCGRAVAQLGGIKQDLVRVCISAREMALASLLESLKMLLQIQFKVAWKTKIQQPSLAQAEQKSQIQSKVKTEADTRQCCSLLQSGRVKGISLFTMQAKMAQI